MTRFEPSAIVWAMAMRFASEITGSLFESVLQIETRGAGVAAGILMLSSLLYGVWLFIFRQNWRVRR